MSSYNQDTDLIAARIQNQTGTAEGSTLPPALRAGVRVPVVKGLKIARAQSVFNGTNFTLVWQEPEDPVAISHFNVYVEGVYGNTEPFGPFTTKRSPARFAVPNNISTRVTFRVQTVLTSGLTSDMDTSPTVSSETIRSTTLMTPGAIPYVSNSDGALTESYAELNYGTVTKILTTTSLQLNTPNNTIAAFGIITPDALTSVSTYVSTKQTTDATATTAQTFTTLGGAVAFETLVIGRRTSGGGAANDAARYKLSAIYKNSGGATLVGAITKVADENVAGWDANFVTSGDDVLIQVTGAAATNINWSVTTTAHLV